MRISFLRRPAAERVCLDRRSPWWGEHRARYHFAAKFVRGKAVLDVAAGTGFGGPILIDAGARAVVGVDLSWEAVREAAALQAAEVLVVRADAVHLPLSDGGIDSVVSFETIEHLEEDELFVSELRRVLHPDGLAVISTPNALQTKPEDGIPANPFHVREYTPARLASLLSSHFGRVELLGQVAQPAYPVNPFWQPMEKAGVGAGPRVAALTWRIQHRMPFPVKDRLSRLRHNRGFYPGEYDWRFAVDRVDEAHVLVAVCRP